MIETKIWSKLTVIWDVHELDGRVYSWIAVLMNPD